MQKLKRKVVFAMGTHRLDVHEIYSRLLESPFYLIYMMWRIFLRVFIGKSRRDEHFKVRESDFVFFPYLKKTRDNFLFYIRKRGDETYLCELNHEPEIRRIFQPNNREVVIDIGAHVGSYTIRLAKKAKFVIAVEPHPSNFQVLKHNITLNKLKNVLPINIGIGREDCTMHLKILPEYCLTQLAYQPDNATNLVSIKVRSLDNLVNKLETDGTIETVDWIKMDTEGMELEVLRGAKQTLRKYNPKLIIEVHRDGQAILEFLSNNHFAVDRLDTSHIFAFMQSTQKLNTRHHENLKSTLGFDDFVAENL